MMVLKRNFSGIDRMRVEEVMWMAAGVRDMTQSYLPETPHKYWVCK